MYPTDDGLCSSFQVQVYAVQGERGQKVKRGEIPGEAGLGFRVLYLSACQSSQ